MDSEQYSHYTEELDMDMLQDDGLPKAQDQRYNDNYLFFKPPRERYRLGMTEAEKEFYRRKQAMESSEAKAFAFTNELPILLP